jgi:hypothetical protein
MAGVLSAKANYIGIQGHCEATLNKDWLTSEEDEAWKDL